MAQETIPFYTVSTPYDAIYRKESTRFPVGPHTHNAAEIYLTLSDLPDVLLGSRISKVSSGSLVVVPPFCIHQMYHEADTIYERYILTVSPDWLAGIFYENDSIFHYLKYGEEPLIVPLQDTQIRQITKYFREFLNLREPQTIRTMTALLELLNCIDNSITGDAVHQHPQKLQISGSQQKVNEIIRYIHGNLAQNISLEDLAKHFYLHPDYLSRLFKKHTHVSVSHYIAIQKIAAAQSMLQEGRTITQVQEALGYSSYAHFSKTFKKLTGICPGEYRSRSIRTGS